MIDCLKKPWQPEVYGYSQGSIALRSASRYGEAGIDLPIRKLATAILVQALKDALGKQKKPFLREEAMNWFFSADRQPGSFYWVSEVMQYDSEAFRNRLRSDLLGGRRRRRQLAAGINKTRLLRPE